MISEKGDNLIFIISQPRAGSTLLQRILGSHPDVCTLSEPWLMLHPCYALRETGHTAEYNAQWAASAMISFVSFLPGGETRYFEAVRKMYSFLYDSVTTHQEKRFFLDKTPRYYFIIPELCRAFPNARFILLFRNPLAVLASIVQTWVKSEWFKLGRFKHDLVDAPQLLLQGRKTLGDRALTVHYESLLDRPEQTIQHICAHTSLPYIQGLSEYGTGTQPAWRFGDKTGVNSKSKPEKEQTEKWITATKHPQCWRLLHDYVSLLGPVCISELGYDAHNLLKTLQRVRPSAFARASACSLQWLMKTEPASRSRWERIYLRLLTGLQNCM